LRTAEQKHEPGARPALLWARFPDEASACPACASTRITVLDVIPRISDAHGRLISFVTGCRDCGLLFVNPLRSQAELDQYYGDEGPWARMVEAQRVLGKGRPKIRKPLSARARLLQALEPYVPVRAPPSGAKALDFGCGEGKFLDKLQSYGWDTYGIEPATGAAFPRHHRFESPPQDASFDLVLLHHVLEHIPEPLRLLRVLAGAMREGAILFISLPRLDTLPQHRQFKYCLDGKKHIASYSEVCLSGLLARAGFATTARLDAAELDDALTEGRPLRLRLIATRTLLPVPMPREPLAPAVQALRQYHRARGGIFAPIKHAIPVRLRGAWIDRARRRSKRSRG